MARRLWQALSIEMRIYIAASYRHMHGVRLLGRELARLGCEILDWTVWACPPPGLTPAQRRQWMDTDQDGGQVYAFCKNACQCADLVIYYGSSGQDAGVEIGLASAYGIPILGIRGPLEAPGLMLHGAADVWVDSAEDAINAVTDLISVTSQNCEHPRQTQNRAALILAAKMARRSKASSSL